MYTPSHFCESSMCLTLSDCVLNSFVSRIWYLIPSNFACRSQNSASQAQKPSNLAPKPAVRSLGLDSTAFDVERYTKQMLLNTRLPQLLQKQNQISSEVKTLDSDMQMLVYENYNKFISATDTIRTMKNSVDNMSDKMQTLQKVTGNLLLMLPHNDVRLKDPDEHSFITGWYVFWWTTISTQLETLKKQLWTRLDYPWEPDLLQWHCWLSSWWDGRHVLVFIVMERSYHF